MTNRLLDVWELFISFSKYVLFKTLSQNVKYCSVAFSLLFGLLTSIYLIQEGICINRQSNCAPLCLCLLASFNIPSLHRLSSMLVYTLTLMKVYVTTVNPTVRISVNINTPYLRRYPIYQPFIQLFVLILTAIYIIQEGFLRINLLSNCVPICNVNINWASSRENLSSGFPTKRISNQSPQLQRLDRKLKFHLNQVYI